MVLDQATDQTLKDLADAVHARDRDALMIEPWMLRRIIRLDQKMTGLGVQVPHWETYTIPRDKLLSFVDHKDLGIEPTRELPEVVVLLSQPRAEAVNSIPTEQLQLRFWRLLFHSWVHREMDYRGKAIGKEASLAQADEYWEQLGESQYREILAVLQQEDLLGLQANRWHTFVEFVAVYLEFRYFSPYDLKYFFPSIADWELVDQLVTSLVPHERFYRESRLPEAADPPLREQRGEDLGAPGPLPRGPRVTVTDKRDQPSEKRLRNWLARAERAYRCRNRMRAAIHWTLVSRFRPESEAEALREKADAALRDLAERLCKYLATPADPLREFEQVEHLHHLLRPALQRAADNIWSAEGRLLFDLQKVCVEYESEVQHVDVVRWVATFGHQPLRTPAPLLRDTLAMKHLRVGLRRIERAYVATSDEYLELTHELEHLLESAGQRLRDDVRPGVEGTLDEVGLVAENVPEQLARDKAVEELLDRVVDQGYLGTGDLRDSLSKGDLKLPDVSGVTELAWGDRVLQADRRLGRQLRGVYRPAMFYLRWTQALSSLGFGTPVGRWLTMYLVLPFGCAFLAVEGLRHLLELLRIGYVAGKAGGLADAEARSAASEHHLEFDWRIFGIEIAVGVFIGMLIHLPRFRAATFRAVRVAGKFVHRLLFVLPLKVLKIRWVDLVLHSSDYPYNTLRRYLLKPAAYTAFAQVLCWPLVGAFGPHWTAHCFLVIALFLNSRVGRFADDWLTDSLVGAIKQFHVRVVGALLNWVMDTFQQLLSGLTRILHTFDEWTRFRERDTFRTKLTKFLGGAVWSVVSYCIVAVTTLLIEPQINPVKHFPVVTVSHKVIIPFGKPVIDALAPRMGQVGAAALVGSTIWLIPGIFGFLVWELKENWRLYEANRPRTLKPVPIGHHGETVVGLLRRGFHSGTLPKLFARLRRAKRDVQRGGRGKAVYWNLHALHHVEVAVQRFVERDFLALLEPSRLRDRYRLRVADVHLTTNRIEVNLAAAPGGAGLMLAWVEDEGRLTAHVVGEGLLERMPSEDRAALAAALVCLFQRSGTDAVAGEVVAMPTEPLAWDSWVSYWRNLPQPVPPAAVSAS